MPWVPGQSGNPEGARKEKKFFAALHRAITQDDGAKVRKAAEQLLEQAANGEQWAIRELRDTLDGKPTQEAEVKHSGNIGLPAALEQINAPYTRATDEA